MNFFIMKFDITTYGLKKKETFTRYCLNFTVQLFNIKKLVQSNIFDHTSGHHYSHVAEWLERLDQNKWSGVGVPLLVTCVTMLPNFLFHTAFVHLVMGTW